MVKEEEGGHVFGFKGSVEEIAAAAHTWVHEVVPSSALAKALAVPWLLAALGNEPRALDTPPFRGSMNAHVTLQFVFQRTLQGAIQHSKPPRT